MKLVQFIIIISFIGCTSSRKIKEHRVYESVGLSAGVEQYFLPDLPSWINFSSVGACHRKSPIKYLDFDKLKKSYNLSYEQNVNLQHMFNRKLLSYGQETILSKDEAFIFYNIYEQVIGGGRDFRVPNFKEISLVWIDPYLKLKESKKVIKKLFSGDVLKGYPVVVTHCLTSIEAETLVYEYRLDTLGVKIISADMFNHYNEEHTGFALNFKKLLPNKNLTLYSTERPKEFLGIDNFIKKGIENGKN